MILIKKQCSLLNKIIALFILLLDVVYNNATLMIGLNGGGALLLLWDKSDRIYSVSARKTLLFKVTIICRTYYSYQFNDKLLQWLFVIKLWLSHFMTIFECFSINGRLYILYSCCVMICL